MKTEHAVFSAGLAAEGGGWRGFTGRAGRRIPVKGGAIAGVLKMIQRMHQWAQASGTFFSFSAPKT